MTVVVAALLAALGCTHVKAVSVCTVPPPGKPQQAVYETALTEMIKRYRVAELEVATRRRENVLFDGASTMPDGFPSEQIRSEFAANNQSVCLVEVSRAVNLTAVVDGAVPSVGLSNVAIAGGWAYMQAEVRLKGSVAVYGILLGQREGHWTVESIHLLVIT